MNCKSCIRCIQKIDRPEFFAAKMILCPTCGNKRCPKATDHQLACTNSNAPGQKGSDYPAFKPLTTDQLLELHSFDQ